MFLAILKRFYENLWSPGNRKLSDIRVFTRFEWSCTQLRATCLSSANILISHKIKNLIIILEKKL